MNDLLFARCHLHSSHFLLPRTCRPKRHRMNCASLFVGALQTQTVLTLLAFTTIGLAWLDAPLVYRGLTRGRLSYRVCPRQIP